MSQAGVVDAHVHAAVLRLDGREHGLDLVHVGQVALERDQDAAVAGTLTLRSKALKVKERRKKKGQTKR